MIRSALISFAVMCSVSGSNAAAAVVAEEVTANGDLEQVELFSTDNSHYKVMKEKGWIIDQPLRVPKGWCPNSGSIPQGEFHLVEDRKAAHSGAMSMRIKGDCYQTISVPTPAGTKVVLSFWAKGVPGTEVTGILYAYGKNYDGAVIALGDSLNFTEHADDTWRQFSHTFEIPADLGGHPVVEVAAALRCYTSASFDDIVVSVARP